MWLRKEKEEIFFFPLSILSTRKITKKKGNIGSKQEDKGGSTVKFFPRTWGRGGGKEKPSAYILKTGKRKGRLRRGEGENEEHKGIFSPHRPGKEKGEKIKGRGKEGGVISFSKSTSSFTPR